jgi:hypothetical protein
MIRFGKRLLNERTHAPRAEKAKKMTKTPGQFEPPKLITKAEREAQKAFPQRRCQKGND